MGYRCLAVTAIDSVPETGASGGVRVANRREVEILQIRAEVSTEEHITVCSKVVQDLLPHLWVCLDAHE